MDTSGALVRSAMMWPAEPQKALEPAGRSASRLASVNAAGRLGHMQRGRDSEVNVRVLPRHTRRQDADSVDLTDAVEELDQEFFRTSFRSAAFRPTRASSSATTKIPPSAGLSRSASVEFC